MADPLLHTVGITTLAAVLVGSLLPDADGRSLPEAFVWNAAHVPAHAILVVLAAVLLRDEPDGLLVSMLLVSVIAMGVEIAQPFVGRAAGFVDYLSNEVGVGLGALIVLWRRRQAAIRAEEETNR